MKKVIKWEAQDGTLFDTKAECAKYDHLFECPKCKGSGALSSTYNAYPSGFPDSGWVSDYKVKTVSCDVCTGNGYTPKKLMPITKIVGYK